MAGPGTPFRSPYGERGRGQEEGEGQSTHDGGQKLTAYDVALFVHLMGVVALFGAFVLLQRGGERLRNATTVAQVRTWMDLLRPTQRMLLGATVMLFLSGMFMVATVLHSMEPWNEMGLLGLVAIAAANVFVQRRHFTAIAAQAAAAPDGPLPAGLAQRLAAPLLWVIIATMNGAATGVVWLMAIKPDWPGTLAGLLVPGALGALIGYMQTRSGGKQAGAVQRDRVRA